eukprot:m.59825 g.59825  ORF g.59825 m.59825 type:complete len:324 (-) comp12258_c0_seq1:28-999(-)
MVKFRPEVLQSFQPAKIFTQNTAPINGLDFSSSTDVLVTSSQDDFIHVYDSAAGAHKKAVASKKYGCAHIRFAHSPDHAIHASTKENDGIRLLSLTSSQYVHYFLGHTAKVTSLAVAPGQEHVFTSSSRDATVRLWDTRTHSCQGTMHMRRATFSSIDPFSLVLAVAVRESSGGASVRLFDLRQYDKGPFDVFPITGIDDASFRQWSSLSFSSDSKFLGVGVSTSSGGVFININASTGETVRAVTLYTGHNEGGPCPAASLSPCGSYVASGSPQGPIALVDAMSGDAVATLMGHCDATPIVRFSPRHAVLASACTSLVLWAPS